MSKAWEVKRLDPDALLSVNARRILAVRIGEYYSWSPIVDDNDHTELLHQLRISAKRLRYTLELFRKVFGEAGERNIARVRDVQELLGTFHDQDVRIALIDDELGSLGVAQTNGPSAKMAKTDAGEASKSAGGELKMTTDDPRRGLINLLERQQAARLATLAEFRTLWSAQHAAGMREDLVALSSLQIPAPLQST